MDFVKQVSDEAKKHIVRIRDAERALLSAKADLKAVFSNMTPDELQEYRRGLSVELNFAIETGLAGFLQEAAA